MNSECKTRNSRQGRPRVSRSAWEISDFSSRPTRSCASKRKFYNEDSDDDNDDSAESQPLVKRSRLFSQSTSESESQRSDPSTPLSSAVSDGEPDLVRCDSKAGKMFKSLPIEIHGNILLFIETDRDVTRYSRICRRSKDAVDSLVWSARYRDLFDVFEEHEIEKNALGEEAIIRYWYQIAADDYKARQCSFNDSWLTFDRQKLIFEPDLAGRQKLWMKQNTFLLHLKNLIFDSNAERVTKDGKTQIVGKNFDFIQKMTTEGQSSNYVDLLDCILEKDFTVAPHGESQSAKADALTTLQLCLLPIILDPKREASPVFQFNTSQRLMYATNASAPLFKGRYKTQVNMQFLTHALNFFTFHLRTANGEGILNKVYSQFEDDQVPQLWPGNIPVGTHTLEGHWKGATTYLASKDLEMMRTNYDELESYQDAVDDEYNCFMDMTFFADEEKFGADQWPQAFESWIISDPYSIPNAKTKALPRCRPELKQFWGTSRGVKTGHMFARLHAISNQNEFHGWQRVSFIKCFEDKHGNFSEEDVWVYEGVVLPGGRIIIGRWMQPDANPADPNSQSSGPFLFWNVDRSAAQPPILPDEAWAFAATINDPLFQALPVLDLSPF